MHLAWEQDWVESGQATRIASNVAFEHAQLELGYTPEKLAWYQLSAAAFHGSPSKGTVKNCHFVYAGSVFLQPNFWNNGFVESLRITRGSKVLRRPAPARIGITPMDPITISHNIPFSIEALGWKWDDGWKPWQLNAGELRGMVCAPRTVPGDPPLQSCYQAASSLDEGLNWAWEGAQRNLGLDSDHLVIRELRAEDLARKPGEAPLDAGSFLGAGEEVMTHDAHIDHIQEVVLAGFDQVYPKDPVGATVAVTPKDGDLTRAVLKGGTYRFPKPLLLPDEAEVTIEVYNPSGGPLAVLPVGWVVEPEAVTINR